MNKKNENKNKSMEIEKTKENKEYLNVFEYIVSTLSRSVNAAIETIRHRQKRNLRRIFNVETSRNQQVVYRKIRTQKK